MDLHPTDFLSGLVAIILIDLVLAGDNAIVIALAARHLPPKLQNKAIMWGTVGAIAVRMIMTTVVVFLLRLPGLMLAGGAVLLPIAWKLLRQGEEGDDPEVKVATNFWVAMRTIIVADALMGLDNVLAIAGASKGHLGLVMIGLLISVPLVVWGSTLILKLIQRYPVIIYIGAAAIAWTAGRMITHDLLLKDWFDARDNLRWLVDIVLIGGITGLGAWAERREHRGNA